MNDLTGQTLGQYRIVEPIGRGGMASVYKAYQSSLDRYVAVKVLPPYYAHEPGFAMRFTREARAVAKLDHPHILPIYDFGQEGDLSYIVMKYVAAGTLKDMLGQPMPLAQAVEVVCQIAAALDHAHEQGVIHRDVKPSNVLMDRGQWALLMDFGLAKMVAGSVQLTASGVGVGTPAYMAPEQGQGVAVDRRSDVYSLGIVLYEMLTGQVPFDAETPLAVVLKHITDPLPLPRSVNPAIPESVERVILKALSKKPDGRYATTREMAAALQRAVAEGKVPVEVAAPLAEAVPKPPQVAPQLEAPPVPETAEAPFKRKVPWWAFAGGAVALVALIGVILAAMGVFSGGEEPTPTSVPVPVYVTEGTLGAVLFEDDFEGQPSSRWRFLPQTWQTETSDGRTFLHNYPTAEDLSSAELRETSWSDYAVQFDFRFLKPDRFGGHYLYIRTRLTNCPPTVRALEGYVVLLSPDVVRLEKETCATQRRDTMAESDRDLALDEWHTVQLVVIGKRIRVLVDGQEQIDFTDQETPLLGGDVIVETENNVEFLLDDFYVYEVIPEEGGVATAPTTTPMPIESIAPSGPAPDTRDIRPCAWDGLGPGLCIFSWEGGDPPIRLLEDAELEFTSAPSWSPDGQRIAFSAQEPGAEPERPNDIYVANADGTDLQTLPSDRNDIVPAWSPDGEWLAFHSNCDLALMHPDGSDFTVIWPHDDRCTMVPQWSPDGERIVFSLVLDGEWTFPMTREVWVISRDGDIITPVATVTHPSQECFQDTVAFSPDNARIAYFEAGCQPMIVNAAGTGQPAPLADFPYWWTSTVYPQWGEGKPEPAGASVSPIEPSGRAIFVDANAPATGSNGSPAAPFNAIQTAIAVAGPGDTIKVATGAYDENLIIEGKTLIIEGGYDANTWEVAGQPADTVIDGGGRHRTVLIVGGSRVVIEGFVVTHGNSPCQADMGVRGGSGGGGILVEDRATEAAIQRSIIRDNIASDGCGGGGIEVAGGATVAVVNSVLTNNSANNGGGINMFGENSRILVVNSTIVGNSPDGASLGSDKRDILLNTIVWGNEDRDITGNVEVSHSLVGNVSDEIDVKDSLISIDPLFADPDVGDYHLQPGSPAVDAGSLEGAPDIDIDGELRPTGPGVDIGADEVVGEATMTTPTPVSPSEAARAFAGPILAVTAGREPTWSDDFSDPTSGWPVGSNDWESWGYEDGVYYLQSALEQRDFRAIPVDEPLFSDFVVEVEGRLVAGDDGSWRLEFLSLEAEGYAVVMGPDRNLSIEKSVRGENMSIIDGLHSPAIRSMNETNRLRIIVQGAKMAIYVNGEPVWFVSDADLDQELGTIAFRTRGGFDTPHRVEFDNFMLWDISDLLLPLDEPTATPTPRSVSIEAAAVGEDFAVTVVETSPVYPAGEPFELETGGELQTQSENPVDVFHGKPVGFRGPEADGSLQLVRYKLAFAHEVELAAVVMEVAATGNAYMRLYDDQGREIVSKGPFSQGNVIHTETLVAPNPRGKEFFLEIENDMSHWFCIIRLSVQARTAGL